jgi:hypothetical protein
LTPPPARAISRPMPRDRSAPAALSACSERLYKSERPSMNVMLLSPREKALRKYYVHVLCRSRTSIFSSF